MKSLKRMTRFMIPYRWISIFLILTVILPVLMELVIPRMFQYVIDYGIKGKNMNVIIQGTSVMLGAAVISAISAFFQGVCRAYLSQGLSFDIRNELFTHIQKFSFGNLDQLQTGKLMTRVSSDVDVVRMFTSSNLSLMLRALLMILGSFTMLLYIDWQLFMIILMILPAAIVIIWAVIRLSKPLFRSLQKTLARLYTLVQENLAGVQLVKAFVREKYERDRFDQLNNTYREQNTKVGRVLVIASPVLLLFTNLGIVAIIWWGGIETIKGRLSLGELVAFNNYLLIGITPLMMLTSTLMMIPRAETSAERILEVFDSPPLLHEPPSPYHSKIGKGQISFKKVVFCYAGDDSEKVLNEIDLEIEAGQRVALIGATGSGKTTLVNLITRFYDPTDGQVKINGVDVRDWSLENLRSQIGIVSQKPTLFSGSIRDNIAFGKPDATLDQVIRVAKTAQAHEFISAMDRGYDCPVEAKGVNLSGGQKQRLAIARALLIDPAILILDDSTSAVDIGTEINIQKNLESLMIDRTTIIIAQRISSVISADQIIVLEAGQIVAKGTHRQLLETNTIYREIFSSQIGEETPYN
jgi:ATP-binding cassette, subfamily B, multidrug efflux pump